jgi:hypothetical protein
VSLVPATGKIFYTVVLCGAVWSWVFPVPEALSGEIFRYRDANGVVHFSNAPTDKRFDRVQPGERLSGLPVPSSVSGPSASAASTKKQGPPEPVPAAAAPRPVPPVPERGVARAVAVPPRRIVRMIEETAIRYRIEKALLAAIVRAESGYDPQAVSRTGAAGLMQLMPETARSLGVRDVFHPQQNLAGGALYFRRLLHRFDGDSTLALAAFNAGPTAVEKYGGVPPFPETRSYLKRVAAYRQEYLRSREQLPHMVQRRKMPQP